MVWEIRVNVAQGEHHVSADPSAVLGTVLGACVAACLRDPVAKIGGMNHFLLASQERVEAARCVHAMELLVNGLLHRGARRSRLEAKLFGGARMLREASGIGEMNAQFTEDFFQTEGVAVVGGSLRGDRGRRLQFWPVSGLARQMVLPPGEGPVIRRDVTPALASAGGVEFF